MVMRKLIMISLIMVLPWLLVSCGPGDMQFFTADSTVPVKSVHLSSPLLEISAADNSFILTSQKYDGTPFYSNDDGPMIMKRLQANEGIKAAGKTIPVLVKAEGYDAALYGRLAIFPASNPMKYGIADLTLPERFNFNITATSESLTQMEKEGTGFSCTPYYRTLHDWCDWALWISKSPIPE
jgi:hypothetical protein